jgi:hypothetical protein
METVLPFIFSPVCSKKLSKYFTKKRWKKQVEIIFWDFSACFAERFPRMAQRRRNYGRITA